MGDVLELSRTDARRLAVRAQLLIDPRPTDLHDTVSRLTLLQAEDKKRKIAIEDIDQEFKTNLSSMPENLARTLAPAEFLDVIEYLSTLK